jgi:excisionase family DNA binding protein
METTAEVAWTVGVSMALLALWHELLWQMSLLWFCPTSLLNYREGLVTSFSSEAPRRRFLTVSQAAELLGVSPMTIYRAIDAGEFPAIRTRGRISIPAKAIDLMEEAAVVQNAVVDPAQYVAQPLEAGRAEVPDPFGRPGSSVS